MSQSVPAHMVSTSAECHHVFSTSVLFLCVTLTQCRALCCLIPYTLCSGLEQLGSSLSFTFLVTQDFTIFPLFVSFKHTDGEQHFLSLSILSSLLAVESVIPVLYLYLVGSSQDCPHGPLLHSRRAE